MDADRKGIHAAFAAMLLSSLVMGQAAYPDDVIQNENWSSGSHHIAVTQKILSPGAPYAPVSISGTADAEFKSGTEIRLMDGFHAGGFSSTGSFHAWIDTGLGAEGDVVVIAPGPDTSVTDNILHVNKWEKLEIGIMLPQAYQDAIDSFFVHYYSNHVFNNATPGNVDAVHDLNPYADDSLQLVMTLTSPSGAQAMKWGFYMREGKWADPNDPFAKLAGNTDSPFNPYHIHFRFAPNEVGLWQFSLSIKAPNTVTPLGNGLPALLYTGYDFLCDPPLPDNKGPLSINPNNRRTLWFQTSQEPFFALGTDMPGPDHGQLQEAAGDAYYSFYQRDFNVMKTTMKNLHSTGGNYLRMWLGARVFAPEWVNVGVYDAYYAPPPCSNNTGITNTGNCQFDCWSFDQLLDTARVNDMYIQLCTDPSHPGGNYEDIGWGSNAYVIHFLEPERDGTGRYDVKKFFYKDGDPNNTTDGVFYYWKRKYKYMMSRWGYSVNLAVIEPFNEIDGLLTYSQDDLSGLNCCVCPENRLNWPKDTAMPGVLNHWLTDIIGYVRGPVQTANPMTSPLGESKLFLLSFLNNQPANTTVPNYFLPFTNPSVDILDIHYGIYPDRATQQGLPSNDLYQAAENVTAFQSTYPYHNPQLADRKLFNQGEFEHYTNVSFGGHSYELEKYFHNYDVSFHDEIWSSAFSGKFAAGTSWQYQRISWWPDALETPPHDANNPFPPNPFYQFSNVKGDTNILNVDGDSIPVVNRPIYHNFKPLADLLANPDWQSSSFLNSDYTPLKVYDAANELECYYLVSYATMAIGWVHNANASVLNSYYLASGIANQNFLGCTSPNGQSISLPGFTQDHGFQITYYPTRMNVTVPPTANTTSTLSGQVILDLSADPLNGIANNYLDTLHSDYAFIITPTAEYKSMTYSDESDTLGSNWDFGLYPNPADDALNVLLPGDTRTDITIYDLSGRRVSSWGSVSGPIVRLSTGKLSPGVYSVRASDGTHTKVKKLVIR